MEDTPETEWTYCGGCAQPVVIFPDYVEDVAISGTYGADQELSGVEHECEEES